MLRLVILLVALALPVTVYANPLLLWRALTTGQGGTDISSFETGNDSLSDGWTIVDMTRVVTGSPYSGTRHLLAGSVAPSITKTITTSAGNIYFWYKATSSGTSFKIDSGTATTFPTTEGVYAQAGPIAVTAGSHTFTLTGAPGAYYDYITIPVP